MIDVAMLRAIGITDEQLGKLFELVEKAERELAAEKREKDRIRKRIERSRPKSPTDAKDIADTVNALSLKKDTSKEETKKETKRERATGKICPTDFKPDEGDYAVGSQFGFSRPQVDGKATGLVEWSQANRNRAVARKSDWHLTLRGALRRDGKPPATADPQQTEGGRELARKTEEYKAQLAARKKNRNGGEAQFELVRRNPNGSGEGSADQKPEIVLQKGQGIHGKEQPPRKHLADDQI